MGFWLNEYLKIFCVLMDCFEGGFGSFNLIDLFVINENEFKYVSLKFLKFMFLNNFMV